MTDSERIAPWVLLLAQLPGDLAKPAGVLLLDPQTDYLHIALIEAVPTDDEDIRDLWEALPRDLAERSFEIGGARLLDSLEEDLSLFLQIQRPRQYVPTKDPARTTQDLFKEHVFNGQTVARDNSA